MLVFRHELINDSCIERFEKTYEKSLSSLKNSSENKTVGFLVLVTFSALCAALCDAFADPIAIAIFGSQFAGLSGAVLTSACLAIVGGTIAIVCVGALLSLSASGTIGAAGKAILDIPDFAMIQLSKLEVAVKEIILNERKDLELAKQIVKEYADAISTLEKDALLAVDLEL